MTKDEVVEQIDAVLHTDLLNETTRNQFIKYLNGLVQLLGDIVRAIQATAENEDSNFFDNLVVTLSGLLTYTQEVTRVNRIFISEPSGVTAEYQVGLSELKTTYFPLTPGVVYNQHPYYGFYQATDISTLNNTSIFKVGALPHILDGEVKVTINQVTGLPRDKVSGYHSNTITRIPTIDPSTIIVDPVTGVYKAKVINPISGTVKSGNHGYSTFLPDNWTAQQKVDAMNEVYNNRKPVENTRNTYEGITKEGIIMEMYIDENTKKVISSFPKF